LQPGAGAMGGIRDNRRMAQTSAVTEGATPRPAAAAAPALEARGLVRDFGELRALDRVSFELGAGETLVVLGPNGAGKTTLLRILATLLRPTSGRIRVLGAELPAEAWRLRGRIGLVGHRPLLYRDLTVAENLAFHAKLHAIASPEARMAELMAAVEIERRADELVRNLSAGLVQRAAICRAVLHEPDLLLLDEPHSHLDPAAACLVEPLIGRGVSAVRVVVTHEVETGLAQADRALLLRAGGTAAYEGATEGVSPGDARAAYEGRA
jgi:heme exporter protein A